MEWNSIEAPWRIGYIRKLPTDGEPACFLCEAWAKVDEDAERYVLHRSGGCMILMNRYPYSNGHLMVVPGEHVSDLSDMSVAGRSELMEQIVLAERVIGATMNPQGVNVGFNIGRAAGAGLPGHLHAHLVPRWGGDTNFMHVVGQVRVIPEAMDEVYGEMKAALERLLGE